MPAFWFWTGAGWFPVVNMLIGIECIVIAIWLRRRGVPFKAEKHHAAEADLKRLAEELSR